MCEKVLLSKAVEQLNKPVVCEKCKKVFKTAKGFDSHSCYKINPLKRFDIKQKKKADKISKRNAKRTKWILDNLLFSPCPECNSSFKDAHFSYIENGDIGYSNTTCDVSCSCGLTLVINKKFLRNKWKITESNKRLK